MSFKKYILSSNNLRGKIILTYEGNLLHSIILDLKSPLSEIQYTKLLNAMPYSEDEIFSLENLGLQIGKDNSHTKIVSFCDAYKQYLNGIKYRVSAADSGKIKLVEVTDDLLRVYFTSSNFLFKGKYSISNYVKYFNELIQEANGLNEKSKYPAEWSKEYEAKLSPIELSNYWKHLHELGLRPVKRAGVVIKWVELYSKEK